jgi:FkbM family methyltransferase
MKKFIKKILHTLIQTADKVMTFVLNIGPAKWRSYAKSRLSIVCKMDYPEKNIKLDVSSPLEYNVRVNSCSKEPETIKWIESFGPKDIVFDVGANVGAYTLVAASRMTEGGHVYAFEPSFLNFPQLCKNIALNGCSAKVTAFNVALADKTGIETFNYQNLDAGGALHTLGEAIDYKEEHFTPAFRQAVLSFSLDDFRTQFKLPVPQHLKIDVDGIEFKVLKGADKTLSDLSLKSILIELPERETATMDYLKSKGFKIAESYGQSGLSLGLFNYILRR